MAPFAGMCGKSMPLQLGTKRNPGAGSLGVADDVSTEVKISNGVFFGVVAWHGASTTEC